MSELGTAACQTRTLLHQHRQLALHAPILSFNLSHRSPVSAHQAVECDLLEAASFIPPPATGFAMQGHCTPPRETSSSATKIPG